MGYKEGSWEVMIEHRNLGLMSGRPFLPQSKGLRRRAVTLLDLGWLTPVILLTWVVLFLAMMFL